MKTNYLSLSNNDTIVARKTLLSDLNSDLANKQLTSNQYGVGTIVSVDFREFNGNQDIIADIKFKDCNKSLLLNLQYKNNLITFNQEVANIVEFAINEYTEIKNFVADKIKTQQAQEAEIIKEREAKRKAEQEAKELEKKRDAIKKSNIKISKMLNDSKINFSSEDNFYVALGYLAKNAKNITAAMPDYLDKWFIKIFGDVPHRSVDQSILSPSGLPSQFALYFKIELKTNNNLPIYLKQYLGDTKTEIKPISATSFVFDLIRDYGFQFGKEQNIELIEENVPEDELENFRLGLNLA